MFSIVKFSSWLAKLAAFICPDFWFISRNSDPLGNERKPSQLSPEKEDRFYATRGSVVADKDNKVFLDHNARNDNGAALWPKLFLSLSSKEKEEDFMAFRGCKPPQRPKRRAKLIQRNVLVSFPLLINVLAACLLEKLHFCTMVFVNSVC